MTQVNFPGRCFNGNGRIRQGIVRTMVTATARGFFILLDSHFLHTPTRVNSHKVRHYIQKYASEVAVKVFDSSFEGHLL